MAAYSVDWGRMHTAHPTAVLCPASKDDVALAIKHALSINMKVAARGRGHSIEGQCLCPDGLVIDMRTLNRVLKIAENTVEVEGGASFIEILEATLPLDLYPSVCLEGTLDISIGGLLSVGGISHSLATQGLLIDTVSAMTVVTGTGEIISCSDTENRDLFRAALGGLGQYGIIVTATISLAPLPQREVAVSLYYDALCAFMGDAAHFARESCDGLLGGMYATNMGTLYTLQVKVHPKDTETTIQARNRLLEGREKDMRDLRNQHIRNFATDMRREQLNQSRRADNPSRGEPPKQLWLSLVMPRNRRTQDMLGEWIASHSLCMFESLSMEVILRERYARQSDSLPQPGGAEEDLIFLYFTAQVNVAAYEEAVRKAYKDLWAAAIPLGAVAYPFCTQDRSVACWAQQQGKMREELERRKEKFDPSYLFAPQQGVFKSKCEKQPSDGCA